MSWFLKDPMLLEDTYKIEDLFENIKIHDDIWKKINWLSNKSILALVWAFWSGKSTCIHNIKLKNSWESPNPFWIHFDAWKYPDRKEMWEWLILDLADQIWKWRQIIADEIDWENMTVWEWIIKTISVIPLLWWIDKLNKIFESKWAKRIFDLQEIFKKIITNFDRDFIIVIEDIDRSWEYWTLFLETLNFFLKNNSFWEKNIKVIVLIWKENYNNNIESYLKCIDSFEFFNPNFENFENFVNTYFIINSSEKLQITSFLYELSKEMSIRLIKNILRKADLIYRRQKDDWLKPDFRINIVIEATRYYKSKNSTVIDYDRFLQKKSITIDSIMGKFLKIILFNLKDFGHYEMHISSSKITKPIRIWEYQFWDEDPYIESFYFKY